MALLLKLSLILVSSLSIVNVDSKNQRIYVRKTNNTEIIYNDTTCKETVFSYLDVVGYYYDLVATKTNNPSKSFDEFIENFYSDDNNLNLLEYTFNFSIENQVDTNQFTSLLNEKSNFFKEKEQSRSSTSDADYILSSTTYNYTPSSEFKRSPYTLFYDYSAVQTGDIVYETETIFFDIGHNAMIVDMSHSSSYGNYIQTIEAVIGGVQYGFLDDLRMAEYKIKILRVNGATNQIIANAVNFMINQLGESYNLYPYKYSVDSNNYEWYCSLLVCAAYYNLGINIGMHHSYNEYGDVYWCTPSDIYGSSNTYEVSLTFYGFLELSVLSKNGNTWYIRIYNTCSFATTCYYNQKMCFENDAMYWSGLNDVNSVYISSHNSYTVSIQENLFADHITTCYINNGYRIITYANQLDSSNNSLSSYHFAVSIS